MCPDTRHVTWTVIHSKADIWVNIIWNLVGTSTLTHTHTHTILFWSWFYSQHSCINIHKINSCWIKHNTWEVFVPWPRVCVFMKLLYIILCYTLFIKNNYQVHLHSTHVWIQKAHQDAKKLFLCVMSKYCRLFIAVCYLIRVNARREFSTLWYILFVKGTFIGQKLHHLEINPHRYSISTTRLFHGNGP